MRMPIGFVSCFFSVAFFLNSGTASRADLSPRDLSALAEKVAVDEGVPSALVHAVIAVESGWRPDAKNGASIGLMQISHATARSLGYRGTAKGLFDPATNIGFGVRYLALAYERSRGDLCATVSRYQSGIDTQKPNAANRAYCARAKALIEASGASVVD